MYFEKDDFVWPPSDGKKFIRSDAFGELLILLVNQLTKRYPKMDFTDAVAQVFAWFDRKLSRNRRFINRRRFPSVNGFMAYLKQSLWNAARLSERERRRREYIEALVVEQQIVPQKASAEDIATLAEMVETLPEPNKTVFHRVFFDEEDLSMIASALDLTEQIVFKLYEDALDMLVKQLSSGQDQFYNGSRRVPL